MNLGIGLTLSGSKASASGPAYSAEATALFARMSSQPDATRKGLIDTFISGLVSNSLWSKIDALYGFAAHDAQASLLNWKGATYNATAVTSPTFTADRGYTGGASSYIDSNFLQSIGGTQYSRDAAIFGTYVNAVGTDGTYVMGIATSGGTRIIPKTALGGGSFRLNTGTTSTIPDATVSTRLGAWSIVRVDSANQACRQNGAQIHTGAAVSTALVAENLTFLRASAAFGTDRIATGIIGALTGAEEATYRGLELTYLTAIGAN